MNAIISKGDKTAHVQLPIERKQFAGALSYLGANHTSDYDLRYSDIMRKTKTDSRYRWNASEW